MRAARLADSKSITISEENFILSIAEERAAAFSPELQGLIGYKLSASVSAPTPPPAPAASTARDASWVGADPSWLQGLGHIYHHDPKGMQKKVAMRNSDFSDGDERTRSKL